MKARSIFAWLAGGAVVAALAFYFASPLHRQAPFQRRPDSLDRPAPLPDRQAVARADAVDGPTHPLHTVGDCVDTRITDVGTRLEGVPDSGSSVSFANGVDQVSYETVPAVSHAQVGDEVRLCLISLPADCPPNDDRGYVYKALDLRTHERWDLPDSEHACGGA